VPRRTFVPKRGEVIGEWSKLHNEELADLYCSPNIIRVIKTDRRGAYRVLVGKPEGKRPLGRPRHRWEDNIKMDLQEVEWGHGLD